MGKLLDSWMKEFPGQNISVKAGHSQGAKHALECKSSWDCFVIGYNGPDAVLGKSFWQNFGYLKDQNKWPTKINVLPPFLSKKI